MKNVYRRRGWFQRAGVVPHRELRERKGQEGGMIHQDGSTHRWVPEEEWDLIVTMDDATGRKQRFLRCSGGHMEQFPGSAGSQKEGIFSSFYSDRGSHYWNSAGGRACGQGESDAVRAGDEGVGGGDDSGLFP